VQRRPDLVHWAGAPRRRHRSTIMHLPTSERESGQVNAAAVAPPRWTLGAHRTKQAMRSGGVPQGSIETLGGGAPRDGAYSMAADSSGLTHVARAYRRRASTASRSHRPMTMTMRATGGPSFCYALVCDAPALSDRSPVATLCRLAARPFCISMRTLAVASPCPARVDEGDWRSNVSPGKARNVTRAGAPTLI
jgi:hypothetical protein